MIWRPWFPRGPPPIGAPSAAPPVLRRPGPRSLARAVWDDKRRTSPACLSHSSEVPLMSYGQLLFIVAAIVIVCRLWSRHDR